MPSGRDVAEFPIKVKEALSNPGERYRLCLPFHMDETPQTRPFSPHERLLIWLSGASECCLRKCPRWEKRKYEAFGASVLVPVAFGMIASSYAVSTIAESYWIIGGFALVWGTIILTIDRVLLATYRAFTSKSKKFTQFVLRMSVAILMGLTVSHPLTLLLFKDTIASEVERTRTQEIAAIREQADANKQELERRILTAAEELSRQQEKYQDMVSGKFLDEKASSPNEGSSPKTDNSPTDQFADIDNQIEGFKEERAQLRADLDKWQKVYDDEISGVRTGAAGIGPLARAIEADELKWRREDLQRLNAVISELALKRSRMSSVLIEKSAAAEAEILSRQQDLEKQKLDMFVSQQGQLVDIIRGQIESGSKELDRMREEADQLSADTRERIDGLKSESRADLMTQTIVLHDIFHRPDGGGHFALTVYVVIVLLFVLIDTIPLVVKFFSVPGPYDMFLHLEEARYTPLHESHTAANPEEFDERNRMFRRQMKSRIDLFREIHDYWDNIPQLPNQGAPISVGTTPAAPEASPTEESSSSSVEVEPVQTSSPPIEGYHSGAQAQTRAEREPGPGQAQKEVDSLPLTEPKPASTKKVPPAAPASQPVGLGELMLGGGDEDKLAKASRKNDASNPPAPHSSEGAPPKVERQLGKRLRMKVS